MHVNWIMCGVLVRGVEMCGGGVVEQKKGMQQVAAASSAEYEMSKRET